MTIILEKESPVLADEAETKEPGSMGSPVSTDSSDVYSVARASIAAFAEAGAANDAAAVADWIDKQSETFAAGYGVSWADFEAAGCVVDIRKLSDMSKRGLVVGYPELLCDGKHIRFKFRSVERCVEKDGQMKRAAGYDQSHLPDEWGDKPRVGIFPANSLGGIASDGQVVLTGGQEDALALRSLGVRAFCCGNDISNLPDLVIDVFLDSGARTFGILLDKNEGNPEKVSRRLHARALERGVGEVVTVLHSFPAERESGWDVCDELQLPDGGQSLLAILSTGRSYKPEKLRVVASTNISQNVKKLKTFLANHPEVYRRGDGLLVRVDSTGNVRPIEQANLKTVVSESVTWCVELKHGPVEREVSDSTCKAFLAENSYPGFREFNGFSDVPVLRPDGSVHQQRGYDPVTGIILRGGDDWNVPSTPDIEFLLEPLRQFPFVEDRMRSTFLAMCLTALTGYLWKQDSPAFLIDASIRGAGKTLLMEGVFAALVCPRGYTSNTWVEDDEIGLAKKLVSAKLRGGHVLCFDNVDVPVRSGVLSSFITSPYWSDRVLGHSKHVDCYWRPTTIMNGNNVEIQADLRRRFVAMRLEPDTDLPEKRTFDIVDLRGWVQGNRKRLIENLLAIMAKFLRDGSPDQGVPLLGSFEGWCKTVASAMVYAGLPNPDTSDFQQENNPDPSQSVFEIVMDYLVTLPPGSDGKTASAILKAQTPCGGTVGGLVAECADEVYSPAKLGKLLRTKRDSKDGKSGKFLRRKPGRANATHWYASDK